MKVPFVSLRLVLVFVLYCLVFVLLLVFVFVFVFVFNLDLAFSNCGRTEAYTPCRDCSGTNRSRSSYAENTTTGMAMEDGRRGEGRGIDGRGIEGRGIEGREERGERRGERRAQRGERGEIHIFNLLLQVQAADCNPLELSNGLFSQVARAVKSHLPQEYQK